MPELVRFDGLEADADEEIRALEAVERSTASADDAGAHAVEQRMVFGQHALGLRRHEDRRAEAFHERAHRGRIGVRVQIETEYHDGPARAAAVPAPRGRVRPATARGATARPSGE